MKAILLEKFGPPETLVYKDVDPPTPKKGFVTIRVKAFGVNHAEGHMRRGEWPEWMPIIGIECVGIVEACPGGEIKPGTVCMAFMGGLGRTINGSYAELTNAPISNVVSLGSEKPPLPWDQLAAIPEAYATMWTCLFRNLELQPGQRLLIRGATSALGKTAVKLAVANGNKVNATSRNTDRHAELLALGVQAVYKEGPDLPETLDLKEESKFDAVLDLVGNSTLLQSMHLVRRGGHLCLAGWLGGLAPISEFNPFLQMPSGVQFSFFGSFHFGTPGYPVSDIPFDKIIQQITDGKIDAKPSRVFKFEEIHEAHRTMEANKANGKMVVLGYGTKD